MDSGDLTREQVEKVRDVLTPHVRYLHKLITRMDRRGFPLDDELYQAVLKAYDAMRSVYTTLHYLSCKSGVGRKRE